ncbi:hypothetical protein [Bradyrhizobium liaoningense]|uniref:hypothetical protein n=1 Tax=Bradyrhizobium liaoningense TaxID=43992 RepID=UPI001BA7D229|nr:hypothetical protein [Bradyrhizobium liaoningense]MBR0719179.1 hypothetical protein [Bradyrhizobium liaoningense]
MRASTAYFVGAGTIVAAIAIGLGGGLIAGNIMHPVTPKQGPDTAKYERRAEPVVAAATASGPSEHVRYLTGSQVFGAVFAPPAHAESQTKTASTEPPAPAANDARTANAAYAPENAYAKASESDTKRAAQERRRAERQQHWAERRRQEMRGPRDRTDWNDVARSVREDSESREFIASRRPALPQIRLFGSDDDD